MKMPNSSGQSNGTTHFKNVNNGRGSAINRALDGSTCPGVNVIKLFSFVANDKA